MTAFSRSNFRDAKHSHLGFIITAIVQVGMAVTVAGCVTGNITATTATPGPVATIVGKVHGGQQPVSGSLIQLYAVGNGGYGTASTPLLTKTVLSDSGGGFNITGDYTCPANSQVYLVATGGNPGMPQGTVNPNLALMAAIGLCSSLTSSSSIWVDERSTVAAVWALSPFMSGYASVSTSLANASGLTNAFGVVPELITLGTGVTPGNGLPANASLSVPEINTLSDVLAPCVNSAGGAAGDASLCGQLFAATTVPGSPAPQDTIAAAINIARNPTLNVTQLFALSASNAPYQPTLTVPPQNFLIAINYAGGGLSAPSALASDAAGDIWIANSGNSTLTELSPSGTIISPVSGLSGGGLNSPTALAIDESGTIWVANRSGNSVSLFDASGSPLAASPLTGGGLSAPTSIAIDEDGTAWIANYGNNSVSKFSSTFAPMSPVGGYSGGGISHPVGVAINPY